MGLFVGAGMLAGPVGALTVWGNTAKQMLEAEKAEERQREAERRQREAERRQEKRKKSKTSGRKAKTSPRRSRRT